VTSLTRILPLLAIAIVCGRQQPRHEACNPADSASLCKQMQCALLPTLPPKRAGSMSVMAFK
jgi:hypothetical protein